MCEAGVWTDLAEEAFGTDLEHYSHEQKECKLKHGGLKLPDYEKKSSWYSNENDAEAWFPPTLAVQY